MKEIKSGKRSHLSTESVEMQSIVYTAARVGDARIKQLEREKIDAGLGSGMFCDDDTK